MISDYVNDQKNPSPAPRQFSRLAACSRRWEYKRIAWPPAGLYHGVRYADAKDYEYLYVSEISHQERAPLLKQRSGMQYCDTDIVLESKV